MRSRMILSGGDGDGTLGAKAVKERGGLTLAQVPATVGPAQPRHAAKAPSPAASIDMAVPAEEMGEQLAGLRRSFDALATTRGQGQRDGAGPAATSCAHEIYAILRSQTGHDFSGYKTKTFMRRVRRRMQVLQNAGSIEITSRR